MEVNLIISRGASAPIAAIEIKSSKPVERKHLTGILSFSPDYPKAKRYCCCQAENAYQVEKIMVVNWKKCIPF